jgi:pilus assembly protein CpaF
MNIEGAGAVTQRDLLINTLRMRPDRIIVGESRGAEALDMLQAMNTGHDGSMTTVHANTPRDAFSRLETMVMMASAHVPDRVIRQQLASAINIVLQCARLSDGSRKVTAVAEVTGVGSDQVEMQDLFAFDRTGISEHGKVVGSFRGLGNVPQCSDRLRGFGVKLPESIYHEVQEVKAARE